MTGRDARIGQAVVEQKLSTVRLKGGEIVRQDVDASHIGMH
jgi:hypothetical protein